MESEWEVHRLGELVSHQKGHAFKSKDYRPQGHGIVRVSDFTDRSIDTESCNYLAEELAHNYDSVALKHGDVIIATVGSWPTNPASVVGKTVRVPKEANSFLLNQNAVKLTANDRLDQTFLFHLLKTETFQGYIVSLAQGSASQASITLKSIFDFNARLPPLPEQKAIAHILGSLDDKIELNRKMNATLEGMAQALFKSWFVDFDPVIDNALAAGNPIPEALAARAEVRRQALANGTANREAAKAFPDSFQETEAMGWIPEGWEVSKAEALVTRHKVNQKFTKKNALAEGIVPIFDQGSGLLLGYSNEPADQESSKENPKYIFGDHTCITHLSTKPFSVGPNVIPLSAKTCDPYWTYYAIKDLQEFQEYRRHWMEFQIKNALIPSKELTQVFGNQIKEFRTSMESNTDISKSLTKLRDTLLPKLISGELRIAEN
jgi:type I restriction enzyme S subunit